LLQVVSEDKTTKQNCLKMENKHWKKKAEDILTDDLLVEKIKNEDPLIDTCDEEYIKARQILGTLSEKDVVFTHSQKEFLGKRIVRTIATAKRKLLLIRISAAAILLLVIGIPATLMINGVPEIKAYVQNNPIEDLTGNTRLILSGDEEIQIKSTDSRIAYAENGSDVRVDSNQVRQVVDVDKVIYNTVIVPYGKRTQIMLSDSSLVWLNSGSKLVYPAFFAQEKREVYLEGEAVFNVAHDKNKPFHVITHDVEVKVLGTVFDISAYGDDQTTTTVLECGSVEMKYNTSSFLNSSKLTMTPGMKAVYSSTESGIKQTQVKARLYTSWKDGYIACEKQSLVDIIKKLSRYYNVSIQMNDQTLADETFTGNLDFRNSATQVLAIIAEFINVKVETVDDKILITRI